MPELGDPKPQFQIEPENSQPIEIERVNKDKILENAKHNWGFVFDEKKGDGQAASEELFARIEPMLKGIFDDDVIKEMREALTLCNDATDKDDFVEKFFLALKPLVDFRSQDRKKFSEIARSLQQERIEPDNLLSEILYCDPIKEGDTEANLHLFQAEDKGIRELKRLFTEGLENLAKRIKDNTSIKQVVASSYLIKNNPEVIVRLFGFTLVSEDTAVMSIGNFLDKYSK